MTRLTLALARNFRETPRRSEADIYWTGYTPRRTSPATTGLLVCLAVISLL